MRDLYYCISLLKMNKLIPWAANMYNRFETVLSLIELRSQYLDSIFDSKRYVMLFLLSITVFT